MFEIIPAILTDDPKDLKKKIKIIEQFSDKVQIDITDSRFVANKTISFDTLQDINTKLFLEIHLMVEEPEGYIAPLIDLGVGRIIFHIETVENPIKIVDKIRTLEVECGIALKPDTSLEKLQEVDYKIDEILLLSVEPGKQGQDFIEDTYSRICEIRDLYPDMIIGVDGGINKNNVGLIKKSGANIAVIGNAIVNADDPQKAYQEIIKKSHEI